MTVLPRAVAVAMPMLPSRVRPSLISVCALAIAMTPAAICRPVQAADLSAQIEPSEAAPDTVLIKKVSVDIDVADDGKSVTTYRLDMTPTNEAAVSSVAQAAAFYRESADELEILEAYTLKKDGRKLMVDTSAIFPQLPQGSAQVPMFDDQRQKVIVFPNVQAGDTVSYTTRTKTNTPFFPGAFAQGTYYPRNVSYGEVLVTITAPRSKPLTLDVLGPKVETAEEGDKIKYTWRYSAPQSDPKPEVVAIASTKKTPRFLASTFKNYDELAHAYAALALPKAAVTDAVRAKAEEITAGITDRRAQAEKLHQWVSREIRYVSIGLGIGSIVPHDADVTIKNGYGDCKDKAVLLTALLAAKGIKSEMVLINYGATYELSEAPGIFELNHAITWIPEFKLYTDTTSSNMPFGVLNFTQYGKPAIHVIPKGQARRETPIVKQADATSVHRVETYMDWTGRLAGSASTSATGPFAIALREAGEMIEAVGPEKAAEAALDWGQGKGNFKTGPLEVLAPSYKVDSTFEADMSPQVIAGYAFYMPPGIRLLDQTGDTLIGPLGYDALANTEPTPCFSGTQVEELSLSPPPGLHMAKLPTNATLSTPSFTYKTEWTQDGRTIKVRRELTSQINAPLCTGPVRQAAAGALAAINKDYDLSRISLTRVEAAGTTATDADMAEIEKAVARAPANPVAHGNKGRGHASRKEYELAIASYDKAIALSPSYWAARVDRGSMYLELGRQDPAKAKLALADLDEAIRLKPNGAKAYAARAQLHTDQKNVEAALTDLGVAITMEPQNAAYYYQRARARCTGFSGRSVAREAVASCVKGLPDMDRAVELDPKNAMHYMVRALLHVFQDNNDKAKKDLDAADALKSDNPEYLRTRAMVMGMGGFKESVAAADALVAQDPANIASLLLKTRVSMQQKMYKEAEESVAAILAIDAKNVDALEIGGWVLFSQKKYPQAIARYTEAAEIDPARASVFERRGTTHYASKNYAKAVADYKKVRELDPSYPEIDQLLRDAEKSAAAAKAKP